MPFYKLICRSCGKAFEKRASIEDRVGKRIFCPKCGSAAIENDYSAGSAAFQIRNTDGPVCPHGASCGCHCDESNCSGNWGGKR